MSTEIEQKIEQKSNINNPNYNTTNDSLRMTKINRIQNLLNVVEDEIYTKLNYKNSMAILEECMILFEELNIGPIDSSNNDFNNNSELFYKMYLFTGQTLVELCTDHTKLNLINRAIEYLSICIDNSTNNDIIGYAYFYRAYGYRKTGQLTEAIQDFKNVQEIDFNDEFGFEMGGDKELKNWSKNHLFDIDYYQNTGRNWDRTINKIYQTQSCVLL